MSTSVRFPAPVFPKPEVPLWPIFLPHHGCPGQCIYCDQSLQTASPESSLSTIYAQLASDLKTAYKRNKPACDLAFFGGTFTALPSFWRRRFLALAGEYRQLGLIRHVRCSTRPDACSPEVLQELKAGGMQTIELGVQTLADPVLEASGRGYTAATVHSTCARIRAHGLELGIQLLPGLPGHTRRLWLQDVRQTLTIRPACVRIYPCLVLRGTPLHQLMSSGEYIPWDLSLTVSALARALFRFWRAGIPVIRIGLPPEPSLVAGVVAGPWHPALGSLVRSRLILALIRTMSLHLPAGPKSLSCPRSLQGDLWGYKGSHRTRLHTLGLSPDRVSYWQENVLQLTSSTPGHRT